MVALTGVVRLLTASSLAAGLMAALPATSGAASPAGAPLGVRAAGYRAAPDLVPGPVLDQLGSSVAMSAKYALVGAPGVNNSAGAAYAFARQRNHWELQAVLTDPGDRPGDLFGSTVVLAGSNAVVESSVATYVYDITGSPPWRFSTTIRGVGPLASTPSFEVVSTGSQVVVNRWAGTGWFWLAALNPPTGFTAGFGCSVAISGVTIVIGVCGDGNDGGPGAAALVYHFSGARWNLQSTLADPNPAADDFFGRTVATFGDTVMVGADGDGSSGAAYTYTLTKSGWVLGSKLTAPPAAGRAARFGSALSVSGTTAVIGAVSGNGGSGVAYIYGLTAGSWRRQAVVTDPYQPRHDDFGSAVATADGTVVIGAPNTGFHTGAAYAYVKSGQRWVRQSQLADPHARAGGNKGAAVAISGSTAVVGAWGTDGQRGTAFIYARSRRGWGVQATLPDPDGAAFDWFGAAVAVSGSTVIVGARGRDSQKGVTFIYVRSGSRWRLEATIFDPGPHPVSGDDFGAAVALSAGTAVIGAPGAGGPGVVYIYRRSGTHWHQQAALPDPDGVAFAGFGEATGLSGGTVVIGASGSRKDTGAAYLFHWSGTRWQPQGRLADPDGRRNDGFGTSVAVSGTTAVIGAPGVHHFTGAAYVYGRPGSRWVRQAVVTIPRKVNIAGGFGSAAAISGSGPGTTVLLSGESVSGLTTTKNRCGSVFEFSRPNGRWKERARVADVKCSSYDEFGYALSISGATGLIGAPGADANAGAAYLLTLVKPGIAARQAATYRQ